MSAPFPSPDVRQEVADLVASSLWALDTHDLGLYLDAFTEDAEFVETDAAGATRTWAGRDAISAITEERFAGPTGHQHRMSNHLYSPGEREDELVVWSYWSSGERDAATGEVAFRRTGWLRDVLRRTEDGWRIRVRRIGPWTGGLVHPRRVEGA